MRNDEEDIELLKMFVLEAEDEMREVKGTIFFLEAICEGREKRDEFSLFQPCIQE